MNQFAWRSGIDRSGSIGLSIASSDDGRLRLTVLGSANEGERARSLLDIHLKGAFPPGHSHMPEVGYLVEDLACGTASVVASPLALRQIFWSAQDGELAIASTPALLPRGSSTSQDLSPDAVYHYVYFHCLPGPHSATAGTSKLDGGHRLEWDGRSVKIGRYWRPSFTADRNLTVAGATSELHELLSSSIRRALESGTSCGAFLSGGLDSSTVAGFAARHRAGIPTVSIGFDAAGYDEISYARLAAAHFRTRPLEYYVTPEDVARTLPDIAAAFSEPFGNSSAAAAFHCARIAREQGIDTLLAGDGGDEIFGGNERYATQLRFEKYGRVPGLLKAIVEPAVRGVASLTQRFPVNKAQSYLRQARIPLPDRLQDYNFLHRIPAEEVFCRDLLGNVDVLEPLRLLREEYSVPADADAVSRMLFLDWKFTLHDNDLVKVNAMCDLAGVRVTYPMLDPALVEFSMRLPSSWKVRGSQLRWFYKRAMRKFLPEKIIRKTKHGFGLPFGTWTRTHPGLQKLTAEVLDSLSRRRFFRPEFISRTQQLHREGHAAYYGELIWILTVLELWLQRHMPRAGM